MDAPVMESAEPTSQPAVDNSPVIDTPTEDGGSEEEDTLSYFAKLAQD